MRREERERGEGRGERGEGRGERGEGREYEMWEEQGRVGGE